MSAEPLTMAERSQFWNASGWDREDVLEFAGRLEVTLCAADAARDALDAAFVEASYILQGVGRFVDGVKAAVRELGSPELAERCRSLEAEFDAVLAEHQVAA